MRNVYVLSALFLSTSCGEFESISKPERAEVLYKIEAQDGKTKRDFTKYESLESASYSSETPYKITVDGTGRGIGNHILFTKMKVKYSGKVVSNDDMPILIQDGSGEVTCSHFDSEVSISKSQSDMPDATCEFQILGYVPLRPAGKAK